MSSFYVCFICFLGVFRLVFSIIAYDCTGSHLNVSTININYIRPCITKNSKTSITSEEFQLLEMNDLTHTTVYSCIVEINRLIQYCGMHSHVSAVSNGMANYIYTLGRDQCVEAHKTGRVYINARPGKPVVFSNLKSDTSVLQPVTLAGSINSDYSCQGTYYADPFGQWSSVIVTGTIRVTLSKYETSGDLSKDVIHLRSGLSCPYKKGSCTDAMEGEAYWDTITDDTCHKGSYKVLYEGIVNVTRKLGESSTSYDNAVVSAVQSDTVFSFRLHGRYSLCHLAAYTTDHPKLLLVKKQGFGFFHSKMELDSTDMDLFAYVNSKFVYVERAVSNNFESLYNYIENQDCRIRYDTLRNQLSIAIANPNEFAYLIGDGPGTSGTLMGEVIYLTKCYPVMVHRRASDRCYQELPIIYNNRSMYMTPRYHTIVSHGQEVNCNPILGIQYHLENSWWFISGTPVITKEPETLDPNSRLEWKYISPDFLATSGIYSAQELDKLRDHLMYGDERKAITNVLSRSFLGQNPDPQGGDFTNFLTEEGIEKMGQKFWSKLWNGFSTFGTLSAGVIGLISIIQLIKWILDSILHFKALKDIYGWSFTLIAAVWDSLTMFLIHRAQRSQKIDPNPKILSSKVEDEHELQNIVVGRQPSAENLLSSNPSYLSKELMVGPYYPAQTMLNTVPSPTAPVKVIPSAFTENA
ncbi:MAG: hypothetical protein [Hangzhou altica cyanea chuvirus 1]|nr:MAG: hypothetical protein [Hangzhou altica cyanea chuvirus 1]